MPKYEKSPEAISKLSPEQYRVTQQNGTERPGTGPLLKLGNGDGAVWGPTRIAFSRTTGSDDNITSQVWTVSPTGGASSARQLTHWKRSKNEFASGPVVGERDRGNHSAARSRSVA